MTTLKKDTSSKIPANLDFWTLGRREKMRTYNTCDTGPEAELVNLYKNAQIHLPDVNMFITIDYIYDKIKS